MRIVEAKKILAALGWHVRRSEGVTFYAEYHLTDRFATTMPQIVRLGDIEKLNYGPSLSTKQFIDACQFVDGGNISCPLINCWEGMSMESPKITEDHFRKASEEVISWAIEQDIEKALEDCAAWPPKMFGIEPIKHLAALSMQGDEGRLSYYQERFAAGDNLGFRKNISMEKIDRALTLAQSADDRKS